MSTSAHEAVFGHLGSHPTEVHPLGGTAVLATLRSGRRLLVKRGSGPNASPAEAAGLRWLGESADVPVPVVHGCDEEWLITDYIPHGEPSVAAAESFGAGLARLHLRGADAFGASPPGGPADAWIGMATMRNEPEADWPTFYARHRVLPYVRRAVDQGQLDNSQAAAFERVCDRLPELAGAPEPPARLHGDAWNGNVYWSADGRAWLIDPAAHGGHRETDLAMLRLFGLPMLDRVLGSYREAATEAGAPLSEGWQERVSLHQLFPLLVHAVLFGGGYVREALSAADTAG